MEKNIPEPACTCTRGGEPGVKKIVVIGPESTGKSTLSRQLAEYLGTVYVPEYARAYLDRRGGFYEEADLLGIARGQVREEERCAARAGRLLVCDTDLYVVKVWSEHRYNRCHEEILRMIAAREYDCYLLTGIDMPWEDDPLREHPLPEMRRYFHAVYKDIVINAGCPWGAVNGGPEARFQKALDILRGQKVI